MCEQRAPGHVGPEPNSLRHTAMRRLDAQGFPRDLFARVHHFIRSDPPHEESWDAHWNDANELRGHRRENVATRRRIDALADLATDNPEAEWIDLIDKAWELEPLARETDPGGAGGGTPRPRGFYGAVPLTKVPMPIDLARDGVAEVTEANTKVGRSVNVTGRHGAYCNTFDGVPVRWRQYEVDLSDTELKRVERKIHTRLKRVGRVWPKTLEWYSGLTFEEACKKVEAVLNDEGIEFGVWEPG